MIANAINLEESYAYCAEVARTQARNFYYSFLVLPEEKRRAFCAVYAYMRHSDDISDDISDDAPATAERKSMLAAWRTKLERTLQGEYDGSKLLPAFHDTLRKFAIPAEYFFELLSGAEMDLAGAEYNSFDDLYRYCYRVAGVVGLTCIRIFGFPRADDARACALAEQCGVAFQLTNILRDLREDALAGRVYLPAEDLQRFGVTPAMLSADPVAAAVAVADADPVAADPAHSAEALRALMQFEIARAWTFYRAALPLLDIVDIDSRPSLWAMIALYSGILKRIEADPLRVFRARVGSSTPHKLSIMLRGLSMRLLGAKHMPQPF